MATVKFVLATGKYQDDTDRHDLIRYMTQKSKTPTTSSSISSIITPGNSSKILFPGVYTFAIDISSE